MNKFWPRRATPKGFSIEKLAKGYREKISLQSYEENESTFEEEVSIERQTPTLAEETGLANSPLIDLNHWANRDFREYKNVA